MYINFEKLHRSGIEFNDLLFLIALKQKEEELIPLYHNEDIVEYWLEKGWIKRLKKGDLRIDTKGELFLKEISSSSDISEQTEKIVDWLIEIYKSKSNGIIKNKKETKRRCQWFTDETSISKNKLALLLKCFMSDSYNPDSGKSIEEERKNNPRLIISNLLDNVFWTPPNNFARHYTLDDSPLWRYYEDNVEWIKQVWNKNNLSDE